MPIAKKYFQDKIILLLLSFNLFLIVVVCAVIVLRLTSQTGQGYIVQYRSNLGIGAYKTGSLLDVIYFIPFAVLTLLFNVLISVRVYSIRRQLAIIMLSLSMLLLILTAIISNALLILR